MARSCWPWQNIRPPFPLQSLTDKSLSPKFYVEDHSNSSLSSRNTIDKLWWKRWNTKSSVRLAGEGKLSKKEKKKKKQTLQFYSYKNHRYMNTLNHSNLPIIIWFASFFEFFCFESSLALRDLLIATFALIRMVLLPCSPERTVIEKVAHLSASTSICGSE